MRWDDVKRWLGRHKGNDKAVPLDDDDDPPTTPPLTRQRIEAHATLIQERLKAELGRRPT